MKRVVSIISVSMLLSSALVACGKTEEASNISEDQMNHFSGFPEHDHPSSSPTNSTLQSYEASATNR